MKRGKSIPANQVSFRALGNVAAEVRFDPIDHIAPVPSFQTWLPPYRNLLVNNATAKGVDVASVVTFELVDGGDLGG